MSTNILQIVGHCLPPSLHVTRRTCSNFHIDCINPNSVTGERGLARHRDSDANVSRCYNSSTIIFITWFCEDNSLILIYYVLFISLVIMVDQRSFQLRTAVSYYYKRGIFLKHNSLSFLILEVVNFSVHQFKIYSQSLSIKLR